MSEAVLISHVVTREPKAVRDFIERYSSVIQSGAARALAKQGAGGGNRTVDIEEAVQAVFLHLLENDFAVLRKYDASVGSLGAFLWKVAYNQTLKVFHRAGAGRQERPTENKEGSPLHQADAGGFAAAEERDELQVLWRQLERELDATDKDLIRMRFVEELPTEILCAELRITPPVLYQRVLRLKQLIRQLADRLGIRAVA